MRVGSKQQLVQGFVVHLLWHELIQLLIKRLGQHRFDGRGRADLAGGLPLRADGIQLHKGVVSHLVDLLVIGLDLLLHGHSLCAVFGIHRRNGFAGTFFQRIGSGGILHLARGGDVFLRHAADL